MDDFTQKMLERTRARREMLQQKMQDHGAINPQRKRKPLLSQNTEDEEMSGPTPVEDHEKLTHEVVESPNKRTRTDCGEDENNPALGSTAEDEEQKMKNLIKAKAGSHVSQRMQKILNQRKVWEAQEQGQDISFDCDNIPSPVRTEESVPVPRHSQSLEHQGRKRRLAALAAKVKGWEDDISHHDPPKTPDDPVHSKPPTGRVQHVVHSTPVERPKSQQATVPLRKAVSQSDELSVASLAKFANVGASKQDRSMPTHNSVIQLGNNSKTILQTKRQTITIESPHGEEKLAPNSKSFQQRVEDLQKNGCKAEVITMNSSSASAFMEKARAERQKELEQLRNRKVHGIATQQKKEDEVEIPTEEENKPSDKVDDQKAAVEQREEGEEEESQLEEEIENEKEGEENASTSVLTEEESMQYENSVGPDTSGLETSAADDQEEAYDDSMLDETDGDNSKDVSKMEEENLSVSEEKSEQEEEQDACQMIDDLFDGVLSEEEEEILTPRSHSPLTLPNLTRVKSRKEIKTELTVRNQTCNEAEDTHELSLPSKFQRTCLSKSNSTESIVSLCQEKDFPVYTISSYRTEKRKSISKRPEKRVVRNEAAAAKASTVKRNVPATPPVQELVSDMMEQVSRQQRIIQQASAALNCCYDAQHGKGSVTEVEAEKLLLIASEKRLALLADIQRLKQKRPAPKPRNEMVPCKGRVKIGNICLPMRSEYISNRKDGAEPRNHFYFVLVRSGHRMFATQLVSTVDDLSGSSHTFKDQFVIDDISSDFQIVLEVYSMNNRTRPDGIPSQDKTRGKLSGILHKSLTPRKLRSSKRSSHIPSMMSPGGPNAIRISSFSLIGSTTVTLASITQQKFTLQKVPFLAPIIGQIVCSFSSNFQSVVEQRGFLTMFDDVGGLGAWHRRWCVLRQGRLYSWTYPDDEQHKKPLMTLALNECISRDITTVERILCARPNTFELRTMRPRRHGDKQNLISQDTGSVITTKHWLSADTKEERVAWIECLNQALIDVRSWDMEALKPFK